jgi:hypothetical protein
MKYVLRPPVSSNRNTVITHPLLEDHPSAMKKWPYKTGDFSWEG